MQRCFGGEHLGEAVRRLRLKWLWFVACVVAASLIRVEPAAAQSEADVPPSLREWIPWVLHELGDDTCAILDGERACAWPGRLELDLDDQGGKFRLSMEVDSKARVLLPGEPGAWPQEVEVDGKEQPVLELQGHPAVEVMAGKHVIAGELTWSRLPETLDVGPHTAFVELSVDDKSVPLVKREAGKIWLKGLGRASGDDTEPEHVSLSVFRQIRDGVPIVVETLLVFQVAGKARELELPQPLLEGTRPLGVSSDLAIALEPSGALRVQLLPGRHELTLLGRYAEHPTELKNRTRDAPWPKEEIWTFRPNPALRTVELTGLAGIDASRTELPEGWRTEGAHVADNEAVLTLTTTRRGQEQVPKNQLNFEREFWLDETAQAFTVRDHITGQMHQGWRLDLISGALGNVGVSGQSQVITQNQGVSGIEIRDGALDLTAVSRVRRTGALSVVGWSEDANQVGARVYLPPGWDLLTATGVDETSRTWLSRWDLFDVFYALLVTFALFRLLGWQGGMIAAIALIVSRGEAGAPEYLWLPMIATAALLGVLKSGRVRSLLRLVFSGLELILVVTFIAFAVGQVRAALYPHLDSGFDYLSPMSGDLDFMTLDAEAPEEASAPVQQEVAEAPARLKRIAKGAVETKASYGGRAAKQAAQTQFKPDSIVQTGPGIPDVTGRQVQLSWSGPVVKDHQMSLYLISPTQNRILTALRLVALGLLIWLLHRLGQRAAPSGPPPTTGARGEPPPADKPESTTDSPLPPPVRRAMLSLFALLIASLAVCYSSPAHAEQPSDARLEQLKARLTEPATCLPDCVSITRMELELRDGLRVSSEVHVGTRAAYRLPGPANVLSEVSVRVDRRPATALRLEKDGAYYVRLEPGVHEVQLTATLLSDRVTLDVGTTPKLIVADATGWLVDGLNEQGTAPGGTLTLQRQAALSRPETDETDEQAQRRAQVAVPPYFEVARTIELGVALRVATHVTRLSDASTPEVFNLRLLPGERLTTPGIEVKDGVAQLSFPREAKELALQSTLDAAPAGEDFSLSLLAPPLDRGTETWRLQCGVVYHCTTTGVIPSSYLENGQATSTFHPWPGEKLLIHAAEPPPAKGNALTVHRATLTLTPGIRTGRGVLEVLVQSSRAVVHTLTIPPDAKLERASVGGEEQAVKSEEGNVRLSLGPGKSLVVVEWHSPQGLEDWFESPAVDVGAEGVNFRTVIELPKERWLLFAGGPAQGPALLFWGYLVLILAASVLLPRLPYGLLKTPQWILLGLGLTQVSAATAVLIAGWFFAVGSRSTWPKDRHARNFLQLLLIGYSICFFFALASAVYEGLVSSPDMEVAGAGSSSDRLSWFVDRGPGDFRPSWVFSVNLWIWRGFMLAWALWLARSLVRWLRWAWYEANVNGFWAPKPKSPASPPPAPPRAAPSTEPTEFSSAATDPSPDRPSTHRLSVPPPKPRTSVPPPPPRRAEKKLQKSEKKADKEPGE